MYSVVLMTALVAGSTTPDWGRGGCCSCYGGNVSYGCGGCYGGCGGCCGGWVYGGFGFAGGGASYHGGCYGAYGAFYGDPSGGCTGCYGCYGGHSCYGIPVPMITDPRVPTANVPARDPYPPINPTKPKKVDAPDGEEIAPPPEKKKDTKAPEKSGRIESNAPVRAKVRIEVPVGGKLYVDDRYVNVAAGTRVFQTPLLAPGERYFYDVRIEVGQRSESRRVIIHPGEDALVNFPSLRPQETETAQVNR